MEIKKKERRILSNTIKNKFKKHFKFRVVYILLIVIITIITLSLGSMYYGMKIYQSGKMGSLNYKIYDFAVSKLNFIPNYFHGFFSKPDEFFIDIKFEDLRKIQYYRNSSLIIGYVSPEGKDNDVPAKLTYRGKIHRIKMSLTGWTLRHVGDIKKWSFRIKMKDDASILRMKEFNLLYPSSRGYLSDWIGHKLQEKVGLIALRIQFVNVNINGDDLGLYCMEENYDKILIENNQLKEGIVFKWGNVPKMYNSGKILKDSNLNKSSILLRNLIKSFAIHDIGIDKLFDLPKMAKHFAVNDLMNGGGHGIALSNTRFYFNPITNLIEPIGREWAITTYKYENLQNEMALSVEYLNDSPFFNNFFSDSTFMKLYINELNILSEKSFLDSFFNKISDEMQSVTNIIYRDNPFYVYPKEFLYNNQNYIRSKIYPNQPIAAYYSDIINNKLQLSLRNLQCIPVRIVNVTLNDSLIFLPKKDSLLIGDKKNPIHKQIEFSIPKGLLLDNMLDKLNITYHLIGIDSIYTDEVFPWSYEETNSFLYNFTKQKPNYRNFNFLTIDEVNNNIVFDCGKLCLTNNLIIPAGYEILINEDTKLNMINSASIISYSPIQFYGSEENPIIITSSDSTGQGIFVLNTKEISVLDHVQFTNLTNPSKNGWELSGAITFYEADVSINNCIFSDNRRGDDFLNIIRSEFDINNTLFIDILSDAFDSDFCTGKIFNSSFVNCGNDAIDISGSNLKIDNVFCDNIGDKGISSGENSQIIANNVKISNSEIAICSKDLSKIIISNVVLHNNQIGFTAFQKKPEFGSGSIDGSEVEMEDVSIPYLIEISSNCSIDGNKIISNNDRIKDILYGVKYGKSSK